MVVICPRCNKELKINEEKLILRNVIFQCTKCSNIFVQKKPRLFKTYNNKIMIAHSNPSLVDKIETLIKINGYTPLISRDGIDAIIKAIKEHPFLTLIEVDLPKINGFKVYKRLKTTDKTKEIKFLFITPSDKENYKEFFIQSDDLNYIDETQISSLLLDKIDKIVL
ncbi:MAG: response regulator [Thermodesulfovibrionales bacterium]